MKVRHPFILHFASKIDRELDDFSMIEYSYNQNLNVIKGTQSPAIALGGLDTQTLTKTGHEASDSDSDFKVKRLLDTSTGSRPIGESSDSDKDLRIRRLLDTSTGTRTYGEVSDSDQDRSVHLPSYSSLNERNNGAG